MNTSAVISVQTYLAYVNIVLLNIQFTRCDSFARGGKFSVCRLYQVQSKMNKTPSVYNFIFITVFSCMCGWYGVNSIKLDNFNLIKGEISPIRHIILCIFLVMVLSFA